MAGGAAARNAANYAANYTEGGVPRRRGNGRGRFPMNATNMRKVLCVQGMPKAGLDLFAARDDIEVEIVHEGPDFDLRAHLGDIHAITLFGTRYTRELIAATPHLEVCSRFGVGFDSVDVAALTERGVPLMVAGTANSVTVAEHAMFMMLDLAKMARPYHAGVAAGNFGVRSEYSALDLYEKRLLSVGFGRIGSRTVKRAVAFEMDVQVYDPYADPEAVRAAGAALVDDLDRALAEADFVTVHCPRNEETYGMIGAAQLARMKPTAIIVTTARGGIVNEAALIEALRNRTVLAAGIDVFDPEPPLPDNPLLAMDNVLLSPHSAGVTRESMDRMAMVTCQNVIDVFDGRPVPAHVVNREVLG